MYFNMYICSIQKGNSSRLKLRKMSTIKELLTANRDSVISSIRYIFKVYKNEDVKTKMIEFLSFCQENESYVLHCQGNFTIKQHLKSLVQRMKNQEPKMKLADIMSGIASHYESEGKKWNPILKEWLAA